MKAPHFLLLFFCLSLHGLIFGQTGKDGPLTVSSADTVNEYTSLTANATAGSTSISVANSGLNTYHRFLSSLSAGDLIMIIQMQGATLKGHDSSGNSNVGAPDDSTWGAILNYNNCGNYEFKQVSSVPNDSTIILCRPLTNNYTDSGIVQIVRVPRYTTLTINNGGIISCNAWNGKTGGIAAMEVENNTIINTGGAINVSGNGFRGGQLVNMSNNNYYAYAFAASIEEGGEKGEGIGGYQSGYNTYGGMYCRGAAANGGGGGDAWNSAGGGGGNGGNITEYNGNGNPDVSNATWVAAWNLEYAGFAGNVSSGGGRGGYGTGDDGPNPLALGPSTPLWGVWLRLNVGGKGGRPLDYSTGRIFIGGGGGAGHEDNNDGGAGGNGGGMIYLVSYGTVSGGGQLLSNGENGGNDNAIPDGDGSGGGGAGGTIIIHSTGNISGITLEANGGTGGSQFIASATENEGGAGGGGGGYIATSNIVTSSVLGGANGTTNASSMTQFPPDGATEGGEGIVISTLSPINYSCCSLNSVNISASKISICSSNNDTATISVTSAGSNAVKYLWSPGGQTSNTIHVKPGSTTTYFVSVTDTTGNDCVLNDSITISVYPKVSISLNGTETICEGNSVNLFVSSADSGTFTWQPGNYNATNIVVTPTVTTIYTVSFTNSCGTVNDTVTVFVNPSPVPDFAPNLTQGCAPFCVNFHDLSSISSGSIISYNWLFGDGDSSSLENPTHCYMNPGSYSPLLTTTSNNGCSATLKILNLVNVFSKPKANFIYSPQPASILNPTIQFTDKSTDQYGIAYWFWNFGDSDAISTVQNPTHTYRDTGTYCPQLTVINIKGCADTLINCLVIDPLFTLYIPSAFTPNGDGLNDVFAAKGVYIKSFEMYIFDRWGMQLYHTTDINKGWNGAINGGNVICQQDSYVYMIMATDFRNQKHSYTGEVTLLK